MKIEHEMQVKIVRYRTIADALVAGLGKSFVVDAPSSILSALHLSRKTAEKLELSEVLHAPLSEEHEGVMMYERTLALASNEEGIHVREFYRALAENGYYPASISEGMSYLRMLATRSVEVETVFHLGTALRNAKCIEKRLLTKKNGTIELVPFYRATKLKPYYAVVVVKKEKVAPQWTIARHDSAESKQK